MLAHPDLPFTGDAGQYYRTKGLSSSQTILYESAEQADKALVPRLETKSYPRQQYLLARLSATVQG